MQVLLDVPDEGVTPALVAGEHVEPRGAGREQDGVPRTGPDRRPSTPPPAWKPARTAGRSVAISTRSGPHSPHGDHVANVGGPDQGREVEALPHPARDQDHRRVGADGGHGGVRVGGLGVVHPGHPAQRPHHGPPMVLVAEAGHHPGHGLAVGAQFRRGHRRGCQVHPEGVVEFRHVRDRNAPAGKHQAVARQPEGFRRTRFGTGHRRLAAPGAERVGHCAPVAHVIHQQVVIGQVAGDASLGEPVRDQGTVPVDVVVRRVHEHGDAGRERIGVVELEAGESPEPRHRTFPEAHR